MKKIISKLLNRYIEHQTDKMQKAYDRFMKRLDKKDEKLDRLYCKIQNWVKGE